MTDVKHTPGPWEATTDNGGTYVYIHADTWMELARVKVRPVPYSEAETVNQGLANARLIAAAPDLFEALKALQRQALQGNARGGEWMDEALELTRAAIAKAEGRS